MMVRITIGIILVIIGFVTPSWLFLGVSFLVSLWYRNFWEIFPVMVVLNSVYVYNGALFEAKYIIWALSIYGLTFLIHTQTRFNKSLQKN